MEIYNYLSSKYGSFPVTGRIFKGGIDITPRNEQDIAYLNTLKLDDVEIIIPPQDPLTILVSLVISVAASILLTPKIPNAANRSASESSPNNGLSARSNTARLGARRPSIYGTVNSVPDLLAKPYKVNNDAGFEVEYNYMFVSEGTVSASIFREASTQLKHIPGSSAELYHPGTSPDIGEPTTVIGELITEPFIAARRTESVTGQLLRPPNAVITTDQIRLLAPNRVIFQNDIELLDKYEVGETMRILRAVEGGTSYSTDKAIIEGSSIIIEGVPNSDLPSSFSVNDKLYISNADYIDREEIVFISNITEETGVVSVAPTVFKSSSNQDDAYKAFDGNMASAWTSSTNDMLPSYLEARFENEVQINSYFLRRTGTNTFSPKDWKLEGSNDDGQTWQDIDEQEGQLLNTVATAATAYSVPQTESFTRIRLIITANNSGGAHDQVNLNLFIFGAINPNDLSLSTRISLSPSLTPYTPIGRTFENDNGTQFVRGFLDIVAGDDVVALGAERQIQSIKENEITLASPGWPSGLDTGFSERDFSVEGIRWSNSYILDDDEQSGVIANLSAVNGMYKDNGRKQFKETVTCVIGVTRVDNNDIPIGTELVSTLVMNGSSISKDSVNKTIRPLSGGRCSVRMHRLSFKDEDFEGTVVDDVRWKDLYSFKPIGNHDIADNTRIRTATIATAGALSISERKLSLTNATRNLPKYDGIKFSASLQPTNSAADILIAISTDPLIGRRTIDELNIDQLYETIEDIKFYFNNNTAGDFCYTLDSSDLTFEDIFGMVSQSIFCRGYRRSTKHYLSFEKAQSTSTLIANHRNKIPNSETRNIKFGKNKDFDGASCKWMDDDGIERTVLVPTNLVTRPEEINFVGLNQFQAEKHAWRAWNKTRYQNLFTQFTGTSEFALSVLGQRILVADNVSGTTYDGEVLNQNGLELELSQDVPATGWIHLQLPKLELQSVQYTRRTAKQITLLNPTITKLSTCAQNYARATYLISEKSSTEEQAFLLLDRKGDKEFKLTLGNYDDRFYEQDQV